MPQTIPLCRQIHTNGLRCQSAALRDQDFCYFHAAHHKDATARSVGYPPQRLTLQPLEDRQAVQVALFDIMEGIASGSIDRKRAGLLLYGVQIAASLLPREARTVARATARASAPASPAPEQQPLSPGNSLAEYPGNLPAEEHTDLLANEPGDFLAEDPSNLLVDEPTYDPIYGPVAPPNPPAETPSNHPFRAQDPHAGPFDVSVQREPSAPSLDPEDPLPDFVPHLRAAAESPEPHPRTHAILPSLHACNSPEVNILHKKGEGYPHPPSQPMHQPTHRAAAPLTTRHSPHQEPSFWSAAPESPYFSPPPSQH